MGYNIILENEGTGLTYISGRTVGDRNMPSIRLCDSPARTCAVRARLAVTHGSPLLS